MRQAGPVAINQDLAAASIVPTAGIYLFEWTVGVEVFAGIANFPATLASGAAGTTNLDMAVVAQFTTSVTKRVLVKLAKDTIVSVWNRLALAVGDSVWVSYKWKFLSR